MADNNSYVPVANIDERIAEIEQQLANLPIELDALLRIKTNAVSLSTAPGLAGQEPRGEVARLGPKQAVLDLLQKEKLPANAIILRLRDRVASAANDVRRSISATIFTIKKAGLIEEAGGLLMLTALGAKELERLRRK
jgi:hypothetical protein